MTLDFETSISKGPHGPEAKNPENDFYTCIYGTFNGITIKHNEDGFKREMPNDFWEMLSEHNVLVGHNIGFDLRYIYTQEGIKEYLYRGGYIWDTQQAEYLLTGQVHTNSSLAELQEKYLGQRIKEDRISKLYKKGIGADKIVQAKNRCPRLFALYVKYCQGDGYTALEIFKHQFKKAQQLGMLRVILMYGRYLAALQKSSISGIRLDLDRIEKTQQKFNLEYVEAMKLAKTIVDPYWTDERLPELNINSPQHKSALLFGGEINCKYKTDDGFYKNGNPKTKMVQELVYVKGFGLSKAYTNETKIKGRYTTDAAAINAILKGEPEDSDAYKYCELQQKAMNFYKLNKTYLSAFLEKNIDEYLYPNFNTTQTATGRLSSSNPNLQNCPSKGEMGEAIQGCFIAPEGWSCVQCDFSQLEIYVLAWLSGDTNLRKDLLSGVDFHVLRLSWAPTLSEGKSYEELYELSKVQEVPKWTKLRSKAKTISYQKQYGAMTKKLSESTGLTEDEVESILSIEDQKYKHVKGFNEHIYTTASDNTKVSTWIDWPKAKKGKGIHAKRFSNSNELLPIFLPSGDRTFDKNIFRNIGYYQCTTGRRYAFEESGRLDKKGKLHVGISHTQTKNYHIQGTAGDVQAITTASLLPLLLKHSDKIRMVNEIHDSKWFYVNNLYLDKMLSLVKETMEDTPKAFKKFLNIDMPFRIPVDVEIGENFGQLTKWESQ